MINVKIPLLSIFICFIVNQSFSQKVIVHVVMEHKKATSNNDTIYYEFDRPLTWNDFKGLPDNNNIGGAVTASGFAFDSQINFDGSNIYLNIGVYTFFSKSSSWKKPEINSDYHLLHEQHHFDITRLGSQKFMTQIENAQFTKSNYSALINSIFEKAYKDSEAMQLKYDTETKHSLDVDKQVEWNKRIGKEIQKLKENIVVKK